MPKPFDVCANLRAGSRILRECYDRAQDWGKAFSCYYSGNFSTGFEHGYVQKIFASIRKAQYRFRPTQSGADHPVQQQQAAQTCADDGLPLVGGIACCRELDQHAASGRGKLLSRALCHPQVSAQQRRSLSPRLPWPMRRQPAGRSAVETAESRPAIPVPGPGALMPEAISATARGSGQTFPPKWSA